MNSVADRENVPPLESTTEAKGETIYKVPPENIRISEQSFKKIVPRFCGDVLQIAKDSPHVSFAEFIDRDNLRWHCFRPMTCDHAIVMHGAMISCRLRTAMLNESEKAGAS